jgi:hypothetical protein
MQCGEPAALHALRAVLDALDIPNPATVGDGEIHDRILHERVLHAVIFLRGNPRRHPRDTIRVGLGLLPGAARRAPAHRLPDLGRGGRPDLRKEGGGQVIIIDMAEFAAIIEAADQLAAEAGPPAVVGPTWQRGFAVGLKTAADVLGRPASPRHTRPRDHLRLIAGGRR